jgi:hypothetical protein
MNQIMQVIIVMSYEYGGIITITNATGQRSSICWPEESIPGIQLQI